VRFVCCYLLYWHWSNFKLIVFINWCNLALVLLIVDRCGFISLIWFAYRKLIPPPMSSLVYYPVHQIPRPVVYGYARTLSGISENDEPEAGPKTLRQYQRDSGVYYNTSSPTARDSNYPYVSDERHNYLSVLNQYDVGDGNPLRSRSNLRPRDSATYYNYSGPFHIRNSLQSLYVNTEEIPLSETNTYRGPRKQEPERGEGGVAETRFRNSPGLRVSQYPPEEAAPQATPRSRVGLTRRPNTSSIYPTDDWHGLDWSNDWLSVCSASSSSAFFSRLHQNTGSNST